LCSPSSCSATNFTSAASLGNPEAKAFFLGPFNTCKIGVTKTCGNGSFNTPDNRANYSIAGIVTNDSTGPVTVRNVRRDRSILPRVGASHDPPSF
jgi:hypothetical protein